MIILTLIFANTIILSISSVPFFVWPQSQDKGNEEHLGVSSLLDKSVNPCHNMYHFACGGWMRKTVKQESQLVWNHWQSVNQRIIRRMETILQSKDSAPKYLVKARNMYNACMRSKSSETKYLNNLKSLISSLRGWPIITSDWSASRFDWTVTVAKITRMIGIYPLLKMHVFIDMQNTSEHILYIEQGEVNLPQIILLNPRKYKRYIQSYQVWILETIRYLFPETTHIDLRKNVTELIMFELKLAQLSLYKEVNEKVSVNTLVKEFPLKWTDAFAQLFRLTTVTIKSDDMVILRSRKYLTKLLTLLSRTKPETIGNYLIWSVIKHLSRDTSNYMRKLNFLMDNIIFGVKEDVPRTQECVSKVVSYMDTALLPKYSQLFLSPETVDTVNEMAKNIKLQFISLLGNNSWLSATTKTYATEKIKALKYQVAYPSWLNNATLIESDFREVNISNNHFRNIMLLKTLKMKNDLQKLKTPVNFELPGSVFEVNAFYNVLQNSIYIPMGMLEPPFFDIKRSMVYNYGALGSLIGHEVSHALDVLGRHADKNGNIKNWWPQKDTQKYDKYASCFKQQYSKYHTNGFSTLGENIADNVGLQISYSAFKNAGATQNDGVYKLATEQLFFISFSQLWCEIPSGNDLLNEEGYAPVEIRVQGTLQNSEEFEKAFRCKANSKKCTLW